MYKEWDLLYLLY